MLFLMEASKVGAEDAIRLYWASFEGEPEGRAYADEALRGVAAALDEVDATIAAASTHWRLERMARVDRNLLRLGTWELAHRPDVPRAVILDEAVELAKSFGTEESSSFVNGVLDRVADTLGRMKRARGAFAIAAAAAMAAACSLYQSGVGPADADGGKDGDAADAAGSYCVPGAHFFCADFDEGADLTAAWCQGEPSCGPHALDGSVALDPDASKSAPDSLVTSTSSGDAGTLQAYMSRALPGSGASMTLGFDVRFDRIATGKSAPLAEILLGDATPDGGGHRVQLVVNGGAADAGATLSVVEIHADGGVGQPSPLPTAPITSTTLWHRVAMDVLGGASVAIAYGGSTVKEVPLDSTADIGSRAVSLGIVSVTAPSERWRAHYDNVTVDAH